MMTSCLLRCTMKGPRDLCEDLSMNRNYVSVFISTLFDRNDAFLYINVIGPPTK